MIRSSTVLASILRSTMKNLQVSLVEDVHLRLKRAALDEEETLANLIRRAIAEFVERHEQRQAKSGEGR